MDQAVAVVVLATVGGARFAAADEHADTLAGETAAVNDDRPFYGTTFVISRLTDSYLIDYATITVSQHRQNRLFFEKSGLKLTKMG